MTHIKLHFIYKGIPEISSLCSRTKRKGRLKQPKYRGNSKGPLETLKTDLINIDFRGNIMFNIHYMLDIATALQSDLVLTQYTSRFLKL